MWEVSNYNQLISFIVSFAFGVLYCLVYDLLRSIRHVGFNGVLAVAIQDVLYFIVIAFVTFMIMLAYTCGEIRFYILFAIFLGFVVCNYTLSCLFRKLLISVLTLLSRIWKASKRVIRRLKCKIVRLLRPMKDFLIKNLKKLLKTLKKILKRGRLVVYTKTDV